MNTIMQYDASTLHVHIHEEEKTAVFHPNCKDCSKKCDKKIARLRETYNGNTHIKLVLYSSEQFIIHA